MISICPQNYVFSQKCARIKHVFFEKKCVSARIVCQSARSGRQNAANGERFVERENKIRADPEACPYQ
jgi:hypothetical protein